MSTDREALAAIIGQFGADHARWGLEALTATHGKYALADALLPLIENAKAEEREACAVIAESYDRDASFDDSQVGASEHNANQANIAQAIRARAQKEEDRG